MESSVLLSLSASCLNCNHFGFFVFDTFDDVIYCSMHCTPHISSINFMDTIM